MWLAAAVSLVLVLPEGEALPSPIERIAFGSDIEQDKPPSPSLSEMQMNPVSANKAATLIVFPLQLLALSSQPAVSRVAADPDPDERKAALAVVQAFFDTMAAKDVEGAARNLIPEGRFYSVREVDGKQVIRTFTSQEYLDGLPKEPQSLRERMWNPEVHVRGNIATVWTPYDFWIGGEFSHCGIDSFNLIKSGEGWKIAGGVYTVERQCEPSPLGPLRE